MIRMAELVQRSELTIWASTVAREEIDRIPEAYRSAHITQYDALKTIRLPERPGSTRIQAQPGMVQWFRILLFAQSGQFSGMRTTLA